MPFNLKKRKIAYQGYEQAVGISNNITLQDIQNAKTQDDLDKIRVFFQTRQNNDPSIQQAIEMQEKLIQEQEKLKNNTGVAPVEQGDVFSINASSKKVFNLQKKAQQAEVPFDPMGLNDSPELIGDNLEMRDQFSENNIDSGIKFKSHVELKQWLDENNPDDVYMIFSENNAHDAKEAAEHYYYMKSQDSGSTEEEIAKFAEEMWNVIPLNMKDEGGEVMGIPSVLSEVNDTIKKIANNLPVDYKEKKFNLKTAQHKSIENVFMWGPSQIRKVDPFLRQPVSDWHIVERNKGFGLVVDDIWNIDYESIWRENIMDKYSRPYRDKDGNWVGGYIQKRFEVDKNIPEQNNYQLKPGQLRKPILPEYGNLEARMQNARSKNKIEGAIDKAKPFNWKEAQTNNKDHNMCDQCWVEHGQYGKSCSNDCGCHDAPINEENKKKKIVNSQLNDIRELKPIEPLKPIKLPGDKDSTQPKTKCPICNSNISSENNYCYNCKKVVNPIYGEPHSFKSPNKNERDPFFGTEDHYVVPTKAAFVIESKSKKIKQRVYESEEFSQCVDPNELKNMIETDDRLNEVWKSCTDLAIDG